MASRLPILGRLTGNKSDPATLANSPAQTPVDQTLGHTNPEQDAGDVRPRVDAMPLGGSGRANFYGLPQWDELNPKLVGPRGMQVFEDMYRTDPHVRRLILAAWSPIVAATWTVEPYGGEDATDQDRQIAETIWWMLTKFMSPTFQQHLYTLGPLLLRSGFVPFEQQWGDCEYEGKTLLAPRKLDVRLPRSVWRWWQDDFGELTHIGQILPNKADVVIPASELCYYRLGAEGDNWMGTSLLRHCYRPWTIKDRLERIQMIGEERKAVGVPVVYRSPDIAERTVSRVEKAIANMHISEVAYLMVPGWKMGQAPPEADPGNQWLIDIVKFDSSSGDAIKQAIEYHQQGISSSFLTDFLELGHHQVGARATADVQEDPFLTAIKGALLPPVLPVLNGLVDRIRKINWDGADGSPTLQLTLHDDASLSEIAMYLQQLVAAQVIQVDPELEDWARERAGLPTANADVRAQRQAQADADHEANLAGAQARADDPQGLQAAAQQAKFNQPPGSQTTKPPKPTKPTKSTEPTRPTGNQKRQQQGKKDQKRLDAAGPTAAGVVMHAADTGRVLMVQRSDNNKWEFPGGKLDDDESAEDGGQREWEEETGASMPDSAQQLGDFKSKDGVYHAFVASVPREADIRPDPQSKEIVDAKWRDPGDLADDSDVRDKVHDMMPQVRNLTGPRMMDAVPTVSVDFDGVIHPKLPNAARHDPVGDPIPGAVEGLKRLAQDYHVVICTARQNLDPVRAWLKETGLGDFAASVTNVKPPAVAYIDDHAEHFDGWEKVGDQVRQELDAAPPPPNLRAAQTDGRECGTCKMFDCGSCWGYGNLPVSEDWVCDSWAQGSAPDDDDEPDADDLVNPKTPPAGGAQLEAAPSARWFDRLLSQDKLKEAMDGARQHVQAAVKPAAIKAARRIAQQGDVDEPTRQALEDAFTQHYENLYRLGHQTVQDELARQRRVQLDDPIEDTAGSGLTRRFIRARQRGMHSASAVVNRLREVIDRQQVTGLRPDALQTVADQTATGALHVEALANANAMLSDGRADAADAAPDVVGAYYTSVLDDHTCSDCEAADTGDMLSPEEAVQLGPPNPDCAGGDRCRCMLVWVTSSDQAARGEAF